MPPISREVLRLAVPAIVHSLLQTFVFVVDRVMLGQHDVRSIAAMQIAGTLEWSIFSVFSAFTVGTVARVGRHVGARDLAGARRAARLSLALAVGIGIVAAALTPVLLEFASVVGREASSDVLAEARGYLGRTLPASPFVFLALAGFAVLQASGDTRTPLAVGVLSNLVHVALNGVLINGAFGIAPMGARGAGTSTALTFALEAACVTWLLTRRGARVSIVGEAPGGEALRAEWRALLDVGLPALLERVVYHAGFLGFVALVALLGDDIMAANQLVISVEALCFMTGDGFGVAAAALVAQKVGERRPDHALAAARAAWLYAVIALTTFGAAFFLGRHVIFRVFSRDAAVVLLAASATPVLALAQPFMATGMVLGQALRGAGRTRTVFFVTTACAFAVRIGSTLLFTRHLGMGMEGVWLGSTADWVLRAILVTALGGREGSYDLTGRAKASPPA